jgi:membrane associated rhomboid family serine protease
MLMSGVWVFMAARPSYHLGASALVYGLASFIFFSGIFRKYALLIRISLLVVFLYGSMIWGMFPIYPNMSWEGHLFGALSGLILAYFFRKEGPQRKPFSWEIEEEKEDPMEERYWEQNQDAETP